MRAFRVALVVVLGGLFVSLWTTLHAQGTIEPKDSDQPVFSGGSAGEGGAPATIGTISALPDASSNRPQRMFIEGIGGDVPEGFRRLSSNAVLIDPKLEMDLNKCGGFSGYPQVDAQLRQIQQQVNKKLEEITNTLNYVVDNQLDPTLQLKKNDAEALEATKKLKDGLDKQYKQAKEDIDKYFGEAQSQVPGAYGNCPVAPPVEPELCQSKQPLTLNCLDQEKKRMQDAVQYWVDRNKWAVDNPNPYESPDAETNSGRDWDQAIKDAQDRVDKDSNEGENAAGEVGQNFEPFKQKVNGQQ